MKSSEAGSFLCQNNCLTELGKFPGYCSLVIFREVFFVNKVHRKPENCGAKSCECMISVHREARYCERSEQ